MRVLVTGGSGMLGSRLARRLLERGAQVRVAYRPGDSLRALAGLAVEHRPADLLDERALARAVEGAEAVFHAAAFVGFRPSQYDLQVRVNVGGTKALLAAAAAAGVRRFVHTSTVNTLGAPPAGRVGDEDTPDTWAGLGLGYMDSKREAERLVLEASRPGFETVALLPGTLFGPGDVNRNASEHIRAVERGLGLLAPPGGTCVAHVDDVAEGHLLALEKGTPGRRYVLGGEPLTYRELYALIARELGTRPPLGTLPAAPIVLAGRAGSWLRRRGVPAPFTEGMAVAICARLAYSSERARRELGWTWRPAAEAVRDAVAWYRGSSSELQPA